MAPTFNPDCVHVQMTGHDPSQGLVTTQSLTNDAMRKGYVRAQFHYAILEDLSVVAGLPDTVRGYHYPGHDHHGWGVYVVGKELSDPQRDTVVSLCNREFPNTPIVWVPKPTPFNPEEN